MIDYTNTSAADDYLDPDEAEVVEVDEPWNAWADGESDAQWLDQLTFTPRRSGINDIWGAYSYRPTEAVDSMGRNALRVASALRLAQGFVNTFATGDLPYRVTFDESVTTAGTDYKSRAVVISHAPLFDKTLSEAEANGIITAMACHESDHIAFGKHTAKAVVEQYGGHRLANRISNILDDVRIERRHVERYPGHAGIYGPAIDYVATSQLRTLGKERLEGKSLRGGNLVSAGVRYPAYVDWTDAEAERDWWAGWSDRGTADDTVATHLAAVAEALIHLREQDEQQDEQDEQGQGGGSGDEGDEGEGLPDCFADGASQAAIANGISKAGQAGSAKVQELAEKAKTLDTDENGNPGEIYWSADGIARSKAKVTGDAGATSAIRAAFNRSRTGHYAVERNHKSGRLDNRSLSRIPSGDYRLFTKRQAQSEGKYLVWLMVDCSGSMTGYPIDQASEVAHSLASAARLIPNVRLDIWGWTTGWKGMGHWGAVRVYAEGDPLSNVGYLPRVGMGGTPDENVVSWAGKAIRKAARSDEQPVLIIASDGSGYLRESTVAAARAKGVQVVSVAIGSIRPEWQARTYGEGNFIPWAGSIRKMAKPLGQLIARIAQGRAA